MLQRQSQGVEKCAQEIEFRIYIHPMIISCTTLIYSVYFRTMTKIDMSLEDVYTKAFHVVESCQKALASHHYK